MNGVTPNPDPQNKILRQFLYIRDPVLVHGAACRSEDAAADEQRVEGNVGARRRVRGSRAGAHLDRADTRGPACADTD